MHNKRVNSKTAGGIKDEQNFAPNLKNIVSDNFFYNITETAPNNCQAINITQVNERDIMGATKKLKNKLTLEPDHLSDFLVKDCFYPLVSPVRHIFSLSLKTCVFPDI